MGSPRGTILSDLNLETVILTSKILRFWGGRFSAYSIPSPPGLPLPRDQQNIFCYFHPRPPTYDYRLHTGRDPYFFARLRLHVLLRLHTFRLHSPTTYRRPCIFSTEFRSFLNGFC